LARLENHKGINRSEPINTANNMRKDIVNDVREVRPNMYGGDGMKNRGAKTLPYPEYLKRREEGCCFHCGGHHSYGYKCPDKNLRVVYVAKKKRNLRKEQICAKNLRRKQWTGREEDVI